MKDNKLNAFISGLADGCDLLNIAAQTAMLCGLVRDSILDACKDNADVFMSSSHDIPQVWLLSSRANSLLGTWYDLRMVYYWGHDLCIPSLQYYTLCNMFLIGTWPIILHDPVTHTIRDCKNVSEVEEALLMTLQPSPLQGHITRARSFVAWDLHRSLDKTKHSKSTNLINNHNIPYVPRSC